MTKILRTRRTRPANEIWFWSNWISNRSRKPIFRPNTSHIIVPKVIIPMPPSWIVTSSTISPNKLKVSAVFVTVRPVTLMALAEVNSASMKLKDCPGFRENGKYNSSAANKVSTTYPPTITWIGFSLLTNFMTAHLMPLIITRSQAEDEPSFRSTFTAADGQQLIDVFHHHFHHGIRRNHEDHPQHTGQ